MQRHVFFVFDYGCDVSRAHHIRMLKEVIATAAAGFQDATIWERAKEKGDAAVKKLIDEAIAGTTVTAVLIGEKTAECPYIDHAIQKSLEHGNGIIGIFVETLANEKGNVSSRGKVPALLNIIGCPIHEWHPEQYVGWIEEAATRAGHESVLSAR